MTAGVDAAPLRCAAHPARPAAGRCPTCRRARCAADARLGRTCALCTPPPAAVAALRPARLVAAVGSVGTVVAVAGAAVGQEYVGARVFSVLLPAVVAVVLAVGAAAVTRAAGPAARVLVAAAVGAYAALSALEAFRLTDLPFGPPGRWAPPTLVAAVVGVAATLLARAGQPARRPQERKTISATPPR